MIPTEEVPSLVHCIPFPLACSVDRSSCSSVIHFRMQLWIDFCYSWSLGTKVPGRSLWNRNKQRCKGEHLVRSSHQIRTPLKWCGDSCLIPEGLPVGQISCCLHCGIPHTSCEFSTAHDYSISSPGVVGMTFRIPSSHAVSRADELKNWNAIVLLLIQYCHRLSQFNK